MRDQREPLLPGVINRSPPVWLKVNAADVTQSIGFFPTSWFIESDFTQNTLLVRLDSQEHALLDDAALDELKQIALHGKRFVFLMHRWVGQSNGATFGPRVESFACPLPIIRQFVESTGLRGAQIPYVDSVLPVSLDIRAFDLSLFLLDHVRPITPMHCLQLPFIRQQAVPARIDTQTEWIILHKGNLRFLEGCLSSMCTAAMFGDRVSIELDEPLTAVHQHLVKQYPEYRFFEVSPQDNGLSASMDDLCKSSVAEYIFFQNSDAVSCLDRRDRLIAELISKNLDIVGCHEVCVDEVQECVQAVRFLVASGPDSMAPIHQQAVNISFSAMRRSALLRVGGSLSTRRFEHATELPYRIMQQGLRVGIVDDYLLVRRTRKNAHPNTSIAIP